MKSENVLQVIHNFRKVLPLASRYPGQLQMKCGSVNSFSHICGSIHCHGGWYALAVCDLNKPVDFTDGIRAMAHDLGFESFNYMLSWFHDNPDIWGNDHAARMFVKKMAFYHEDKRPFGATTLQDIVDHWTDVHERLLAREKQQTDELINTALNERNHSVEYI